MLTIMYLILATVTESIQFEIKDLTQKSKKNKLLGMM